MDDDLSEPGAVRLAPPRRPLLGLTILVVEDSRYASEALRLLCLRSGARIRRADCLAAARRHLRVYRPSVAVIDLGLPDGSGLDLIADLKAAPPGSPAILAISGAGEQRDAAFDAGADAFLAKPVESLGVFQQTVVAILPALASSIGLRLVINENVEPDRIALHEDLNYAAGLLDERDGPLDYTANFLKGVARIAHDPELLSVSRRLAACLSRPADPAAEVHDLRGILARRLSKLAPA